MVITKTADMEKVEQMVKKLILLLSVLLISLIAAKFILWDLIIQGEDGVLREKNILPVKYADYIDRNLDYSWAYEYQLIAHALGGVEESTYTNSKEAFIENYQKGQRVFEVDLIFTSDDVLVCKHDWDAYEQPLTKEAFLNTPVDGKYTPITFSGLLELLHSHPDAYIVTDTKSFKAPEVTKTFQYILTETEKVDSKILNRIIPQIYIERMLGYIDQIYPFNSYIYTLYKSHANNERVLEFAVQNGIEVITLPAKKVPEEYPHVFFNTADAEEVRIFVHTINVLERLREFKEIGASGVYTDFIVPGQLK